MRGILGDLFDLNHDGEVDAFERALELDFIDSTESADEEDDDLTELELAGIDPAELEYMDEDERREVLEDAGLDPDDYDF